jgi:hypothetical protein
MSPIVLGQSIQPIAFVNVNVIPMDSERVLNNQTVITFGSLIVTMGSVKEVQIPENARRIEGEGKFLMPGLADMHTHSWGEDFIPFIVNGVTTIRNMGSWPFHLDLRKKVISGEVLGPTMFLAGPSIDGPPSSGPDYPVIDDPLKAVELVIEQKETGYDFIKVLSQLSPEVFAAIDSAAQAQHIPMIGHPPFQVDFEKVLSSGILSIEHLEGYNIALMSDDAPMLDNYARSSWLKPWKYFDESKLQELAKKTAKAGIWNCPTLVIILNGRIHPSELEEKLKNPNLRYIVPNILEYWREREYLEEEAIIARETDRYRKKTVKALHDAGAKLLLGTDTQQFFTLPGFSLHEELEHFVDAGLSPYEAIKAGTTNAAEFLQRRDEFGKVEIGFRADLILLHSNPLDDIKNTTDRMGVMLRGKWFQEYELKQMLEDLALSIEKRVSKE